MDCNPPGSSVHGTLQARILEWVAMPPPGDLPDPGIKPGSPALQADALPTEPWGKPMSPSSSINFSLFIFNLFCYVHDGSWLFDILLIGSSFQQYKTYFFILFAVNIAFPVSILWGFLDTHLHIFPFVFNVSISFICVSFWKNSWNWIFKQSIWEFNSFTSVMIADIFRAIYIMPLCIFYLSCFSFGLYLFFCLW